MRILRIERTPFHEVPYRSSAPAGQIRTASLPFLRVYVEALPTRIASVAVMSDLQGRAMEPENRLLGERVAEELAILAELGEIPAISVVVLAGDLYDYPDCQKMGGTGDVTAVWNTFAGLFPNVTGVHGNHDIVMDEALLPNVHILDGSHANIGGLSVGGISGIIGRPGKNQRMEQSSYLTALERVVSRGNAMTVLHEGPDGPANEQLGNPLIREVLRRSGSGLVVFGHCHWREPLAEVNRCQAINVDSRVCIIQRERAAGD